MAGNKNIPYKLCLITIIISGADYVHCIILKRFNCSSIIVHDCNRHTESDNVSFTSDLEKKETRMLKL